MNPHKKHAPVVFYLTSFVTVGGILVSTLKSKTGRAYVCEIHVSCSLEDVVLSYFREYIYSIWSNAMVSPIPYC